MPRTISASIVAALQSGTVEPVVLADLTPLDGVTRYWSDTAGTWPDASGASREYSAWIKSVGPIRRTKDGRSDGGDLVVQNLTGNTISRDVAGLLAATEFEGALVVLRLLDPLRLEVVDEFHGYLTEPSPSDEEVSFRLLQLTDMQLCELAIEAYSDKCTWRYKSAQCGSTSGFATCNKTEADCVARGAIERHNAMPPALGAAALNRMRGGFAGETIEIVRSDRIGSVRRTYTAPTTARGDDLQIVRAELGRSKPLVYGRVRAVGNTGIYYETESKTRYVFTFLGEGEFDGIDRMWINRKLVDHTNTAIVHFHPGKDGVIGDGRAATSTGGDAKVDAFFSSLPAAIARLGFSRTAYAAFKAAPDAGAPGPELEWLIDLRGLKVRIFDAAGNQTGYAFSTNPAWVVLDLFIRGMLKREAGLNEALTAAEKARIDFPSFVAAATYYDELVNGNKRFEVNMAVTQPSNLDALSKLALAMARSYVREYAGKIYLFCDKPRASTFTLTSAHVLDARFSSRLRATPNRFVGKYRDLSPAKVNGVQTAQRAANVITISTVENHAWRVGEAVDLFEMNSTFNGTGKVSEVLSATQFKITGIPGADATIAGGYVGLTESRFMERVETVDHEQHQIAIGQRGSGLARMARPLPVEMDFGMNVQERVIRLLKYAKWRALGYEGANWHSPWEAEITLGAWAVDAAGNAAVAQLAGDIITIDKSVSEEFAGDYEIEVPELALAAETQPATLRWTLKQYVPEAFTDDGSGAQNGAVPQLPPGQDLPFAYDQGVLVIDPSTGKVVKKGSMAPTWNAALTYVSDTGSITWGWGFDVLRSDAALTKIRVAGSQPITGLNATTTYRFYPFFDEQYVGGSNMLRWSQALDNAVAWGNRVTGVANPAVVADDTAAPDGSLTAEKITLTATGVGQWCGRQQKVKALGTLGGRTFTASIYLKAAANVTVKLYLSTPTGVMQSLDCAVTTAWQRFTLTWTVTAGNAETELWFEVANPASQAARTFWAWGAQLVEAAAAAAYTISEGECLDAVDMVRTGGVGTPPWAHTTTSREKTQEQYREDHVPLSTSPMTAATTSAGSGGGSGGGDGSCIREDVFVRSRTRGVIRGGDVKLGEELWNEGDTWVPVWRKDIRPYDLWIHFDFCNGVIGLPVTAGHTWTLAEDRSMRRASEMTVESAVPTPTGIAYPTLIRAVRERRNKVCLWLVEPHTFFVSTDGETWVLSHNMSIPYNT